MIVGRPASLVLGLITAILNCAVVVFGVSWTSEQLAALNAVAASIITIIANANINTALNTWPPTTDDTDPRRNYF